MSVAWYDLGGGTTSPPLLLAHATGFHGRMFSPLAAALTPHFRCVAFDERGHGDTPAPADGRFDWHGFADDALEVVDEAGLDRPYGFGHSAGGAALLLAEIARPGTFRAIYCFEPVVPPSRAGTDEQPAGPNPLVEGARRRRADFASFQAAYDNFSSKPPMSSFRPEVLRAYVEHGFRPLPDGAGVTLKCRPEHEAATYEMADRHDAFARLDEIECPVTVAWGGDTVAFSTSMFAQQAERLRHARSEPLSGLSHFGPFEDPDRVAASVLRAFGE